MSGPDGMRDGAGESDVDGSAEAQAEEYLREVDTSSRFRTEIGAWEWLVGGLSVALTLFHLYTGLFGSRPSLIQGAIHVGGATSLIFLLYPVSKRALRTKGVPWYDLLLAMVGLGANIYTVVMYDHLSSNLVQIMGFSDLDYAVAAVGIVQIGRAHV